MLVNSIIILLFIALVYFEIYTLRYFFEKYFIVTEMSEQGIKVKQVFILKTFPLINIDWSDITAVYKIEGHDSASWFYKNVQKKLGTGIYWRLVLKTTKGVFVFHPAPVEGLNTARLLRKFDHSSELEAEILRRNIPIAKEDIKLIDTLLSKKDWYQR